MSYSYCLTCRTAPDLLDQLYPYFFLNDTLGVEEIEEGSDIVVKGYFQNVESADQAKNNLLNYHNSLAVSIEKVLHQDWNKNWRDSIEPILVANNIWVSPSWCSPRLKKNDTWIKIEPRMAFGTGRHESTRLAAKSLLTIEKPEKEEWVLDIGTGSGILCFIASIAGLGIPIGIDFDPQCITSLTDNIILNPSSPSPSFVIGSIDCLRPDSSYRVIVINMIWETSIDIIKKLNQYLSLDGCVIWSGLLCSDRSLLLDFLKTNEWEVINEMSENEWWCCTFKRARGKNNTPQQNMF